MVYNVATVLWLQFMPIHIMLFTTLNSVTLVMFETRVQRPVWLVFFFSSLISCFPLMLFMYFLNDFWMVQFALIITGIAFVFFFLLNKLYFYYNSLNFKIFLFFRDQISFSRNCSVHDQIL